MACLDALKTMNRNDYPHQQKRFVTEYASWAAVESIESDRLLTASPLKQLCGTHAMEMCVEAKQRQAPGVHAKKFPRR